MGGRSGLAAIRIGTTSTLLNGSRPAMSNRGPSSLTISATEISVAAVEPMSEAMTGFGNQLSKILPSSARVAKPTPIAPWLLTKHHPLLLLEVSFAQGGAPGGGTPL